MPRILIRNTSSAVSFPNASSAYIKVKSGAIVAGSTNFTITAWVNLSISAGTAGYAGCIYSERPPTGNDIVKLGLGAANSSNRGKLAFDYRDDAGTLSQVKSTNSINANGWSHIALVKSGTSYTFYINGSASGTGTLTPTDTLTSGTIESRIGGDVADSTNAPYKGIVSDIAVFSSALSASDVSALYSSGTYPTGLVSRWRLNEGSGTTVADSQGSNTGTVNGAVAWVTDTPMITRLTAV